MYNFPAGNPINSYTYKDLEALYPIYIGYQEQYYNTYHPTSLSQRIMIHQIKDHPNNHYMQWDKWKIMTT
jgi:hypothetical protein